MPKEPVPISAAEIANEIANGIEQTGLHPACAFAVRHCGFLLTEMNVDKFTDDEIAEWEDTLDRWFEMHPEAEPL